MHVVAHAGPGSTWQAMLVVVSLGHRRNCSVV
jgi:hypothetical protein